MLGKVLGYKMADNGVSVKNTKVQKIKARRRYGGGSGNKPSNIWKRPQAIAVKCPKASKKSERHGSSY